MNSLEIVNEHIKFIDDHSTQIKGTPVMIDELQQIKQDLEVLEIIRKKKVDIEVLEHSLGSYSNDLFQALYCYNGEFVEEYHLTMEELLKLNQWLEVNDNE